MKGARQGLRALRPTRPAGPALPLALPFVNGVARGGNLDFAPWHAPRGRVARGFRPDEPRGSPQGTRRTKTVVVVAVRRPWTARTGHPVPIRTRQGHGTKTTRSRYSSVSLQ